jgi:uncharacterized protein (DUF433 family)
MDFAHRSHLGIIIRFKRFLIHRLNSGKIRYDPEVLLFSKAAMTNLLSVIHSDPDILGGTPVFVGTRVPVKNLLDYLAAGDPLSEFLDHFPSVRHDQAIALMESKSSKSEPGHF